MTAPDEANRIVAEVLGGENLDAIDAIDAISKKLPDAEAFPVDALPGSCARLVREAEKSIVCPPEFLALPLLVMLGSAIGNSRVLKLKDGWEEGAAIYAAVVANPGDKKTPAAGKATEAAWKKQAELRREYRAKRDEHEREMREYEVQKKDARNSGLAAPPPPREPVMERTVVEDTTTEALVCILEGTPRGVMVVKDELSGWIRSMDQYKAGGKGADRQFYLSAWSNSPVAVDRKSQQEPVMLPRPSVGVFGSIQPGVLPELDSGREDGLLDRFLFAYPAPMRSRWSDAEISVEARLSVAKLYERLLALPMPGDEHGDPDPVRVEFSLDAKTVFVEVVNGLREEMELPGFPERLKGPWSKLESYLARLCLILAMARAVQGVKGDAQVEAEDVLKAAAILDYFKNHARRVYVGLHGESSIDRLAADVARFLDDRGGYWKGEPSELHGLLQSSAKPKDARWLSRRLEAIAERYGSLRFDSGNVWKEGQSRRFVELVLENSVNSVNSVKGGEGLEPDAARNHEPPVIPEVAERVRQALEERLKTRPRLINDTPAGIAAELFIHTDLGAAPEEVEEALKRMKA